MARAQTTTCEHCGTVIPAHSAERVVADGWTHYFCSERCKIQWGAQAEIEEEE
jgi:YHS domain-containing protein